MLGPDRAMLLRADLLSPRFLHQRANDAQTKKRALEQIARDVAHDAALPGLIWPEGTMITPLSETPALLERRARRMARSNALSGGGMLATALIQGAAERHPGVRDVAVAARGFRGAYTGFRDLPPRDMHGLIKRTGYALPETLRAPGQRFERQPGSAVPVDVLMGHIVSAGFHDLHRHGLTESLNYRVPAQEAPGEMRILVDRASVTDPTVLMVQIDDANPIVLHAYPQADAPSGLLEANLGATGLQRFSGNLQARLSERGVFTEAPTAAARLVLPLPQSAKNLRIWRSDATNMSLRIAVQLRIPAKHTLDAPAFLRGLAEVGLPGALRQLDDLVRSAIFCVNWLEHPSGCMARAPSLAAEELQNDLLPFGRLLRARERLMFDGLKDVPRLVPPGVQDAGASRLALAEALALEKAGTMLPALERFADAARIGDPESYFQARLGQARALLALGERFLGERLARLLVLSEYSTRMWPSIP